MKKLLFVFFIMLCANSYGQNYIEWSGKKEIFDKVNYIGSFDSAYPKQIRLEHSDFKNKKFQYIRISGFETLKKGESISLCTSDNCLKHVGIIDQESYYYYQAKTATINGLGENKYELVADFHLVGMAGNEFKNNPEYPNYILKAIFTYIPEK